MESELRQILAQYGTAEVHKTLMKIMRDDYQYLRGIFEKKQVATNPVVIPDNQEPPRMIQLEEAVVPVAETPIAPTTDEQGVKHLVVKTNKRGLDALLVSPEPALAPAAATEDAPEGSVQPKGFRDPKEIKAFQMEAEAKKRAELDAQGITAASLLTRENLEKWIVKDGLTFAAVAREHVGCPADLVASTAKAFGIQSENSKRRGIVIARKKKSN